MKCTRQSDRNFWLSFGRRAVGMGLTLESLTTNLKPHAQASIAPLITEGYNAGLRAKKRREAAAARETASA